MQKKEIWVSHLLGIIVPKKLGGWALWSYGLNHKGHAGSEGQGKEENCL